MNTPQSHYEDYPSRLENTSRIAFLKRGLPWLLQTVLVTSCSIKTALPSMASSPTTSALEMTQSHVVGGPQKLILSKTAVRIEHPNTGVIVLSHHPFQEVTIFNPKKKCFIRTTTQKAIRRMRGLAILLSATGQLTELKWTGPENTKFHGRSALMYTKTSPQKSWVKYWVLKEPKLSHEMLTLICKYSADMPDGYGIPLRMEEWISVPDRIGRADNDAPPVVTTPFNTKSIQQVTLPITIFEPPKNCTKTSSYTDVMTSGAVNSLHGMMQSPDFLFQSAAKKLGGSQSSKKKGTK